MRWMVRNSSGKVAGTGRTFLSACLYLRTRVAESVGGRGGNRSGGVACAGRGGIDMAVRLWMDIILTAGAHPV